jgi:uncharacterized protein YneF (UPF0154 family)
MTIASLAIISLLALVVGVAVGFWNMTKVWNEPLDTNPMQKMAIHMLAGLFTGMGSIGLIGSLVWYIILQVK